MLKWKKLVLPLLLVIMGYVYLPLTLGANELETDDGNWNALFNRHIDTWVEQLHTDSDFTHWKEASREVETMGPGTHQWIVTFLQQDRAVGYMIVAAQPFDTYGTDGTAEQPSFILLEYGLGDFPLYDSAALSTVASFQAELDSMEGIVWNKWYGDALHALWSIEKEGDLLYFDAKSGEMLPITEAQLPAIGHPNGLFVESQLQQIVKSEDASVKEEMPVGWAHRAAVSADNKEEIKTVLTSPQTQFSASLYGDQVLAAFHVMGYHEWGQEIYVALEDEGLRYIPLNVLISWGKFYN
jgi:hypothetical protein